MYSVIYWKRTKRNLCDLNLIGMFLSFAELKLPHYTVVTEIVPVFVRRKVVYVKFSTSSIQ